MPRPEVNTYAEAMETELKNNASKGTWKKCELPFLINKLDEEVAELKDAAEAMKELAHAIEIAKDNNAGLTGENIKALEEAKENMKTWLLSEAADVGNIAMFIADILEALPMDKKAPYRYVKATE
jgi:cell division FtsZ-interacting protein ZapD